MLMSRTTAANDARPTYRASADLIRAVSAVELAAGRLPAELGPVPACLAPELAQTLDDAATLIRRSARTLRVAEGRQLRRKVVRTFGLVDGRRTVRPARDAELAVLRSLVADGLSLDLIGGLCGMTKAAVSQKLRAAP